MALKSIGRATGTRVYLPWSGLMALGLLAAVCLWGSVGRAEQPAAESGEQSVSTKPDKLGDPMTMDGQRRRDSVGLGRQHRPSTILMGIQEIPLRFSHRIHTELLECTDCHDTVDGSVRASDVNLPTEETCLDCHDLTEPDGDPPARCDTCHTGFKETWKVGADKSDTSQVTVHPAKIRLPTPHLRFNHKLHLAKGVQCSTCHGDLEKVELATVNNALPLMGKCLECHDGKQAPAECATCHLTVPDGRLKTDLPGGKLKPAGWYFGDAHDDGWLVRHRSVAQIDDQACASCHSANECLDCHNGVRKPMKVHPNNWIVAHPVSARKNSPDCMSCHQTATFCVDCHQVSKVSNETDNNGQRPWSPPVGTTFHPQGWVGAQGSRTPSHHSFEAQRNIRSCASCHTENSCTKCHSTTNAGGRGYSPHRPGFLEADCERMLAKSRGACVKCHAPGEPALSCRR